MIAAVGDVGERVSRPVAPLGGHDQGAVGKSDPLIGRRGEEPPFRLLQLAGEVSGLGPAQAVVPGADPHDLGAPGDVESGLGAVLHPLVLAGLAPHPHGPDEDLSGLGIDQDARVADAVFLLGPPAPFAHVHDHPLGPPGAAAVGAAAQPDVDVFLQVARLSSPHVVDAQQCALGSGGQRGDAVGVHPFLHVLAQSHPDAFADLGSLVGGFHRSRRGLHGGADRIHPAPQVGVGLQPNREPEEVLPRRELPVALEDQLRVWGRRDRRSGLRPEDSPRLPPPRLPNRYSSSDSMSSGSSAPLSLKVKDRMRWPGALDSTVSRIRELCSFRISTGCTRWEAVTPSSAGAGPPHPAAVRTRTRARPAPGFVRTVLAGF